MSIRARVIRSIALQEIDNAPHAQTSSEGHNKGLQGINSRRKELHIASISPGICPGHEKSRHHWRQVTTSGQSVQKWDLYIGIRVVHIVIVEDVLVLAYGLRVCPVHLVHFTSLV